MPTYKLIYFNYKGKGEVIRLLFAAANVEYEDHRIDRADWPGNLRESLKVPFGQLPILDIDGQIYCQSNSICRYIAEKYGLAGETELDRLRCDMVAHCVVDISAAVIRVRVEKDEQAKAKLLNTFITKQLDVYLVDLQKILDQNNSGEGFFVGNSLTWADLSVFHCVTASIPVIGVETSSFIGHYPRLKSLLDRVASYPRIAAYLAKRPVTFF